MLIDLDIFTILSEEYHSTLEQYIT